MHENFTTQHQLFLTHKIQLASANQSERIEFPSIRVKLLLTSKPTVTDQSKTKPTITRPYHVLHKKKNSEIKNIKKVRGIEECIIDRRVPGIQ